MNINILKHLVWKDARILAPAAIAMLAAVLVFYVPVYAGNPKIDRGWMEGFLAVQMFWSPLLALACGVFLIGSERDTRSLEWISSLPISWRAVLASKIGVACAALLVLVSVQVLLFWLSPLNRNEPSLFHKLNSNMLGQVLYFTLFVAQILLWSAMLCLWTKNTMAAAVLSLPVYAVAQIITLIGVEIIGRSSLFGDLYGYSNRAAMMNLNNVLQGSVVLLLLIANTIRFRQLVLHGGDSTRILGGPTAFRESQRWVSIQSAAVPYLQPRGPWQVLFWQQFKTMKWLWTGVALISAIILGMALLGAGQIASPPLNNYLTIVYFFVPAILGISVFSSDWVYGRFEQIASTGFSPLEFWWQRQIIPLSLLVLSGLCYICMLVDTPAIAWLVVFWCMVCYLSSVWLSGLMTKQVLAALASIVMSAAIGVSGSAICMYVGNSQVCYLACVIVISLAFACYWVVQDRFERGGIHRKKLTIGMPVSVAVLCVFLLIPMRIWEVPRYAAIGKSSGSAYADMESVEKYEGQSWLLYFLGVAPWEKARSQRLVNWANTIPSRGYQNGEWSAFEDMRSRTLIRVVVPATPQTPVTVMPPMASDSVGTAESADPLYGAESTHDSRGDDSMPYGMESTEDSGSDDARPYGKESDVPSDLKAVPIGPQNIPSTQGSATESGNAMRKIGESIQVPKAILI